LTPLSVAETPFIFKNARIKFSELANDPALGGGPAAVAAAWATVSHKGVRIRAETRKETKQALLQLLSGTQ
jgi:hypothetical protein